MSNVIELKPNDDGFTVDYVFGDDGRVSAVGHPEWPFKIVRNEGEIAFVSEDGEPFGILDADKFNTVLMCWLLVDSPDLIDEAQLNGTEQ